MPPNTTTQNLMFKQYALAVNMANDVSVRRGHANMFFLSLHGAALSYYATIYASLDFWHCFLFSLVGLYLCFIWTKTLAAYALLNKAKFDVINQMESEAEYLFSYFTEEWRILKDAGYPTISTLEKYSAYGIGSTYIIMFVLQVHRMCT